MKCAENAGEKGRHSEKEKRKKEERVAQIYIND